MNALTLYFIGRRLKRAKIPLLPRLCEGLTFLLFNSSVPLSAEIGEGSRCEHRGIAVVIHPDARIGRHCMINPQVVIGGRGSGRPGVPVVGDRVRIGVGAKLLGAITVGDDATIGANAVVLIDVPPGSTAVGVPAHII